MVATGLPFTVQERDIDLLILEQLHLSPEFLSWLAGAVGVPGARLEAARHSVVTSRGETDVLVTLRSGEERVAVMIEDKIGAPMQPRQAERYHERGRDLCAGGEADRFVTVLCAPRAYLAGVPDGEGWQVRLPLESLADWFGRDPSPASAWRRAILLAASGKLARARAAEDRSNRDFDPTLLAMKQAYRELVEARFPELIATPQTGRDREYYLKGRDLPSGLRFKHAFFRGEVSLIIERAWAERAGDWLAMHAPEGTHLIPHGGELHLRRPVEVLDPGRPLAEQVDLAAAALDEVCRLLPLAREIARGDHSSTTVRHSSTTG